MAELMTLAEAARRLEMSPRTLRIQARRGSLAAIKPGGDWLVTPEEVMRYAMENRRRPKRAKSQPPESQPSGE